MARNPGRSHTTVNRELQRHRHKEDPDHRKYTKYCIFSRKYSNLKDCNLPPSSCLGKCSRGRIVSCNKHCPDFVEDKCRKLDRSPYVCNGCKELKSYSKRKYFYLEFVNENNMFSAFRSRTGRFPDDQRQTRHPDFLCRTRDTMETQSHDLAGFFSDPIEIEIQRGDGRIAEF